MAPLPARALMPWYGVTRCDGFTPALPPPCVIASVPASSPITASECTDDGTGSAALEFLSRTLPSSATCWDSASCAGVVTTESSEPELGLSNRPCLNIDTRMRRVWSLMVSIETWPLLTALVSAEP